MPAKQPARPATRALKVVSHYEPSGDQPTAIRELVAGVRAGDTIALLQANDAWFLPICWAAQRSGLLLLDNTAVAVNNRLGGADLLSGGTAGIQLQGGELLILQVADRLFYVLIVHCTPPYELVPGESNPR